MKKALELVIVFMLFVAIIIASIAYKIHKDTARVNEWLSNCTITTVCIQRGDTLDHYGHRYKPNWMDIREYRSYVMELNDMKTAYIYAGQTLKFYVGQGRYTSQCGDIYVIYGDNGTPNYVDDDVILGTTPIVD